MDTKTEKIDENVSFEINPDLTRVFQKHHVVVVIPAYNEERFIGSVVIKTQRLPVTTIVVDDGSTDDTGPIAQAAGAMVIRHKQNMGKGEALNTGIREARKMNPDAIVVIDGDGQHLVSELPQVVQPILMNEADIVIGSRYLQDNHNTPSYRKLGHWFFNKLTGVTTQINVSDSQSGYRALSPRAFNTDLFFSSDFTIESEMQFFTREHDLRLKEVPITIRYVDAPKRSAFGQGVTVLNGILHLIGQYRPLLFFGLPGLITILGGFTLGFLVIDIYRRFSQLAVGYAMISVLLAITGMVLFSTGIILHSIRGLLIDMLRKNGNVNPIHQK